MSKSMGNYYQISDLRDMEFSAENIRYQLLSGHYRTKIIFSSAKKHQADKVLHRLSDFKERITQNELISNDAVGFPNEFHQFCSALNDDLDTPRAFAVYFAWMKKVNKKMDRSKVSPELLLEAKNFIDAFENIFGLLPSMEIIPPEIISLAKQREEAREKGDWAIADKFRNEIEKHGFVIEDTIKGYKIKKV